jgi:hypothetical protein
MLKRCDIVDSNYQKSFRTRGAFPSSKTEMARCLEHRAVLIGRERKPYEVNRATAGN